MLKTYYCLWYRLDDTDGYLIWYSNDQSRCDHHDRDGSSCNKLPVQRDTKRNTATRQAMESQCEFTFCFCAY